MPGCIGASLMLPIPGCPWKACRTWWVIEWLNYIFIQGVPKKLEFTFLLITQLILIVETRRLSIELSWQEVSNDMWLDFLRYLVPEKIDFLGERTITTLHYKCMNIELLSNIAKYWPELFSGWILALQLGVFLILNVLQRFPFSFLYIDFCHAWVVKESAL